MKRFLYLFLGLSLMAFGTALCRQTGLGIDSVNAIIHALSHLFSLSIGMISLLLQTSFGILVVLLDKKLLGWGSLLAILSFGFLLQFFNSFLQYFFFVGFALTLLVFGVGLVILAFGMAIYMESGNGLLPYDCFAYILSKKWKKNPFYFRVFLDTTVALLAYVLGGPIHIGTAIMAFALGPIIDYCRHHISLR